MYLLSKGIIQEIIVGYNKKTKCDNDVDFN